MKTLWMYILLLITLVAAGSACSVSPVQSSAEATAVASPPAPVASDENTLLIWEGPALFTEDQTECHHLRVTRNYQAFVGRCNGEQAEIEFVTNPNGGLADMVAHFAPFQVDTPQEHLTFNGQGEIAGPAWARAITNWALFTHAELATGRVGAANRTVLAWNLDAQDGQCRMLLVLSHGYATAGLTPCEGGQMEVVASDWIDSADWEQFDVWLYHRAPFYQDNNYFGGRGDTEMSAEEAVVLVQWAETVYAKLN